MNISASVKNLYQQNNITVTTNSNTRTISIPAKTEGYGSSVNGGELLFLSLATCFCNDIYREAARRKMNVHAVEVIVSGEFGNEGEPAANITYEVEVQSPESSAEAINDLIGYVDRVAEIHNTLRKGVSVSLNKVALS